MAHSGRLLQLAGRDRVPVHHGHQCYSSLSWSCMRAELHIEHPLDKAGLAKSLI